jgi:hypothetical protein
MNDNSIFANTQAVEEVAGKNEFTKIKNYSDCYLYGFGNYEKELVEFVIKGTYLNKTNEGFKDLVSDIKRQRISSSLVKVLESDNTILVSGAKPMPRAFKYFVAKDMKGDKKSLKLYIDVTGLIDISGARYTYINIIISYLMAGMNSMIYYVQPNKITGNSTLLRTGCECFSKMIFYIIDYLRLSGDSTVRGKIMYLASKYYQINLLGKEESDSVENWALKTSGISSTEAELIMMKISSKEPYKSIYTFVKALSECLRAPSLTVDVIVDKWMYTFGSGSQFGLELYPAYAGMLIYAYVGAYLNNQKTLEKIIGRPMMDFVEEVIRIGSELI